MQPVTLQPLKMGAWRCLVLQCLTEPNALLTELTLHGWRVVGCQKHAFGKESSIDITRFHFFKGGIAHLLMSLAKKSAEGLILTEASNQMQPSHQPSRGWVANGFVCKVGRVGFLLTSYGEFVFCIKKGILFELLWGWICFILCL